MAKEVAIGKRAKISEAQEYMLLAVIGAAIFLGVAISLIAYFVRQISFNAGVISKEDESIVAYSNAIKRIGICSSPAGETYTDAELKKCKPDDVDVSSIPNTLRANIIEVLAANKALNSVPKENSSECINPETGKNFTYSELTDYYNKAESSDERQVASELIQSCSALRVIPDALPAFKNEEALLSSLNKIFIISNWEPETLSPTGNSSASSLGTHLNAFSINLSVEADSATTVNVINNIERSIREFDIERASIKWGSDNTLVFQAQAKAFYMTPSTITETTTVIKSGENKK